MLHPHSSHSYLQVYFTRRTFLSHHWDSINHFTDVLSIKAGLNRSSPWDSWDFSLIVWVSWWKAVCLISGQRFMLSYAPPLSTTAESPQNKKQSYPWSTCNCCIPITSKKIPEMFHIVGQIGTMKISKQSPKPLLTFCWLYYTFIQHRIVENYLKTQELGWGNRKKGNIILSVSSQYY